GGGGGIHAEARIVFTSTGVGNPAPLVSATSWSPPACYYAPLYTPAQMRDKEDHWLHHMTVDSPHEEQVKTDTRDRYDDLFGEDGEFPDFHTDRAGEGMFWSRVINRDHPDRAAQLSCEPRLFWVDFGDPPPPGPGVVDTATLAALAWEYTRVPETEVTLNPEGSQVVNLPSWVWLDDGTFEPVTVRAELPDYGIWAETVATPRSLRLTPGTPDAALHPASGRCEARNGRIGDPWSPGRTGEEPPCGITYLRSTTGTPHTLGATLVWGVFWTDSLGGGSTLPDGEYDTTLDVTVDEIQAVVR
ncbi:hypothetical protein, partial [Streptomyces alkaliphilus]|uniref:hypothetical protein n=1 Tax=Streptomyces alkaliphilus TaxID=1472722 RepID=UPI001E35E845